MTKKKKFEMYLDKSQIKSFLESLAKSIDEDQDEIEQFGIDLSHYGKLKVTLEKAPEQMRLKLKVKQYESQEEEEQEIYNIVKEKEEYKKIKERMEKYLKEISESVDKGNVPSREIVTVFLYDAQSMLNHHLYEPENYNRFQDACSRFKDYFEAEDMEKLRDILGELYQLQNECHSESK